MIPPDPTQKKEKTGSAVYTVFLMTLFTLLAKALGLLRSTLIASRFGAGSDAAAFSAASRIPLSFFDLLFSAAILGCFIPLYNSIRGGENEKDGFANRFFVSVSLFCSLAAGVGILFAPPILRLFAPDLSGETFEKAVLMLRILFPMVPLAAGTYTLVGILQSKERYLLPASVSLFSNGTVVLYLLFFNRFFGEKGIVALSVFTLLSWVVQLLTLLVPLARSGFRIRFLCDLRDRRLLTALKMTPPILLGSWLLPAGWLIATRFNTEENVAVFEYANTAYLMLAGILTYSICNYIFPKLSRMEEGSVLSDSLGGALSAAAHLIFPFAAALPVLGNSVVSILYLRGSFTPQNAASVSHALTLLGIALPFFPVNEILSRGFYSRKKTLPPMFAAVCGVCVNFCICLFTSPSLGLSGICLGAAAGQAASALFLWISSLFFRILDAKFFFRILPPLCGGIASFFAMRAAVSLFPGSAFDRTVPGNLLVCLAVFAVGLIAYAPIPIAFLAIKKIRAGKITSDSSKAKQNDQSTGKE